MEAVAATPKRQPETSEGDARRWAQGTACRFLKPARLGLLYACFFIPASNNLQTQQERETMRHRLLPAKKS